MATTSIGSDRKNHTSALERYPDAVFVRDDKKFYFGNGGDVYFMWDNTNGVLKLVGLPTSNPGIAGAVFVSGSDLMIHA